MEVTTVRAGKSLKSYVVQISPFGDRKNQGLILTHFSWQKLEKRINLNRKKRNKLSILVFIL